MDKLPLARNVIKVVALAVGGLGTVLCTMAIVGLVTDSGWARVGVAVVFATALPALLADRLMPEDPEAIPGATSDVFAFTWMAVTLGVALGAGAVTRPVLAAEGDRLAREDLGILARALYVLAGVTPTVAGPEPPPTSVASATDSSDPVGEATTASADAATPTVPFQGPPIAAADPVEGMSDPSPDPSDPEEPSPSETVTSTAEEPEPPPPREVDDVFALALPSLATVTTDSPRGLRGGSGVFVADDLVATCRHLFDDATAASLTFPSSRDAVEALTIVGEAPDDDLVLVRVAPPPGTTPAPFPFATEEPTPARRAIVVGDPVGLGPTLSVWSISEPGPDPPPLAPLEGLALTAHVLGSPVYDERGQLRGIVTDPHRPRVIAINRIVELIERPLPNPRPVGTPTGKP